MTDTTEDADPNDLDGADEMAQALQLHRCLAECQGLGTAAAAHVMIGCAFFVLGEDLPLDEALENLDFVRKMIAEREAELRANTN